MFAISVFLIGFMIRISGNRELGRIVYALSIMLWILRILDFLSVNRTLGPYVVMIIKMVICFSLYKIDVYPMYPLTILTSMLFL